MASSNLARRSLGLWSPEPSEGVGQDHAVMVAVVAPVSHNKAKVVPAFSERGSDP